MPHYALFWFSVWTACTDNVPHLEGSGTARIFHAIAAWCVRGEQASSSTGQQGNLDKPALCYHLCWCLEFRVPLCVPPKLDMQIYWPNLIIYLVELTQLSHQSVFVLKKPYFPLSCLGTKICKCSTSEVLRYTWISYATYSTFIFVGIWICAGNFTYS